ncbi:MAG: tRNA 2-thiocytidine biosynthesis protein TtcA, partial [Candidatus Aenigmarchaeota archaeon]|nr:tRNA 2-thiocytidine biosynthesis protein TtcA [Candidatus Aenigmarchaeota archaeon]
MVCKCGEKTYFKREYEGVELCRKCFVKSMEKKIKKLIRYNKLLDRGDKICVAISGGKDSIACLYILNEIVKKRDDIEIFAIAIDEGLGEYRNKTIGKAKEACELMKINLKIYSFKEEFGKTLPEILKLNPKLNACTYCGVLRRSLLNKKARENKATKLAFGFNLNDEAESVMLNFVFGNVDKFLRLGPKVENKKIKDFIPRIKPLREIPEKENFIYCD